MSTLAASDRLAVLRPPFTWSPDPTTPGQATWVAAGVMATLIAVAAIWSGTTPAYVAVPISLVVLIAFLVRPLIGFALMLAIRPTLDLWANTTVVPLASHHPINSNSLMAGLVLIVGGAYLAERWADVRRAPAMTPMLVFGVLVILSIPLAVSKSLALTESARYLAIVVMYGIAFSVVRNRRSAGILASAILLSAAVPVIVAIGQVTGTSLQPNRYGFFRAHGTLVVVDAFGIFLALVITFATGLALSRKTTRWRWALWAGAPFVFFALINSYGRTGWIASTFGLVVLGGLRYRWLLAVIPILLLGIAIAVPSTTARFNDLQSTGAPNGPGNTFSGRIGMWRDALPHLQSRPVLGIGFGSDSVVGKRQVANDYVRALVETGIPGGITYVWLLVAALLAGFWGMELAQFSDDRLIRALTLGSFAVVPAYMLVSITSNMMTQVVVAGMFWSMAAIGHAYLKRDWDGLRP